MKQRRLGDMLVSRKVLTAEQLNNALKQKMPGEKIGETLMRLKLIDEDQLTQTLCLQLGIEPVDLDRVKIPAQVLSAIPADICRSQQGGYLQKPADPAGQDDKGYALSCDDRSPERLCKRTGIGSFRQEGRTHDRAPGGDGAGTGKVCSNV